MANSTLTISFSTSVTDDDLFVDMDLDDEKNEDETSFSFGGGTVYFRLFTNCEKVSLYSSETSGTSPSSATGAGSETANIKEAISFTQDPNMTSTKKEDNNTTSLSYPAESFSATAISGVTCGSISLDPNDDTNKTAIASQHGVGVYEANYTAKYHSISIESPSMPDGWDEEESYPVVIVAVGS